MHIQFTTEISLGQVLTVLSIGGIALKFHKDWVGLITEHKFMWHDFCKRHNLPHEVELQNNNKILDI